MDDFSTDKTIEKIKKLKLENVKIFQRRLDGFDRQRNFAINKASSKWVLMVDADERLSPCLASGIYQLIKRSNSNVAAYEFLRRNFFYGKLMKYGGWQNDWVLRLFKKNSAKYVKQEIHEYLRVNGQVDRVNRQLYHFSHRKLADNLLKTIKFEQMEAGLLYKRKIVRINRKIIIRNCVEHFIFRFIKQQGFRDGVEGFIEAMYQTFSHKFILLAMIWEKQRGKSSQQLYQELDQKLEKNNFTLND